MSGYYNVCEKCNKNKPTSEYVTYYTDEWPGMKMRHNKCKECESE